MEHATLNISVREFRLFVERMLYQTKIPRGYIPELRDTILYAHGFALDGVDRLLSDFACFASGQVDRFGVRADNGYVVLDADNQHSWLVVPVVLDLALMEAASGAPREIRIESVQWPAGLTVLEALAFRHSLRLEVSGGEQVLVRVAQRPSSSDPLMSRMLADGVSVKTDVWWKLYHLSSQTLTPDSQISRRHAGPVILLPDGQVIGQQEDEDLDIRLILGSEIEQKGNLRVD